MTMKVFEVRGIISQGYSADCAIVVAESEKQAYDIVVDSYTEEDGFCYYELFSFSEMKSRKYCYIKEMKDLEYKGTEPKILSQICYVE